MYSILRPLLFCLDAERAHAFSLAALHYMPKCCFKQPEANPIEVMGLKFPHCLGLAAGLDKNGEHLDALAKLGFAFIELGTVTPRAQIGNPKPRLFRLSEVQALINRMGFNNLGVDALVARVKAAAYQGILGINIGKNKETPLERAAEDYLYCLAKVYEYASYITLNISSPNTPDLRQLQQKDYLANLLSQVRAEQLKLSDKFQRHVPLVLKLSPDEERDNLKHLSELAVAYGIEGLIATNTSTSRFGLKLPHAEEQGGLSGKPLHGLSTECLRWLKSYLGNALTLIGSGGIEDSESARAKLDAGASLLQVYTALIYKGPRLVQDLLGGLAK